MIYAIYIYTSYVWHRLILHLPAWIAFNQRMKENTSWSSQDHSSHTRKEAPFWQLTLAQVSHKADAVCHRVNPRCPVPPTKASKNCHAAPSLPMNLSPGGTSLSFSGGGQLSNASIGRDSVFGVAILHPTETIRKLRKFLVDRTTSFNGSILMFVHSKGLQQSLALACRYITWQKTSHWEMPIFPTFLSGHWNVLECTAITGRSGLIRPLIISCVGNQDAAVPEPPTEAIWGTIQSLFFEELLNKMVRLPWSNDKPSTFCSTWKATCL